MQTTTNGRACTSKADAYTNLHELLVNLHVYWVLASLHHDALLRTGKSRVFEAYESIPEYSAVGASPSNGKAEHAVQTIQDQLRTPKSAIESRIDT